jgi:ribosome biogenesis protein MAK21
MKSDTSYRRVVAFVKRMLQSLTVHQPPFICGALYLLGEVRCSEINNSRLFITCDQLFNTTPGLRELLKDNEVKRNQVTISEDLEDPTRGDGSYDPKKRDPQWANAHRTCLWELVSVILRFPIGILIERPTSSPSCTTTTLLCRYTRANSLLVPR